MPMQQREPGKLFFLEVLETWKALAISDVMKTMAVLHAVVQQEQGLWQKASLCVNSTVLLPHCLITAKTHKLEASEIREKKC